MPKELFGTDGIRGEPGKFPLDDATLYATGRALGAYLKRTHSAVRVKIIPTTRQPARARARRFRHIKNHQAGNRQCNKERN